MRGSIRRVGGMVPHFLAHNTLYKWCATLHVRFALEVHIFPHDDGGLIGDVPLFCCRRDADTLCPAEDQGTRLYEVPGVALTGSTRLE